MENSLDEMPSSESIPHLSSPSTFLSPSSGSPLPFPIEIPADIQDPGRVLPGKKMAGHMGVTKTTTQNLLVHRVDTALNLVYVRGAVPGVDDAYVAVRDSKKKVAYRAQNALLKGVDPNEWLREGVTHLPTPAGTVERVKSENWPEVVEWPGKGQ